MPKSRNYKVIVKDLIACGKPVIIEFNNADTNISHTKTVKSTVRIQNESPAQEVINIMSRWQTTTAKKSKAYKPLKNINNSKEIKSLLSKSAIPQAIKSAIIERI